MDQFYTLVQNVASSIGFMPSLLLLSVVGLYAFWAESHSTRKDRNSVFDIFILVIVLTVVWGRFSYILSNPSEFEGLIWSIAPYEKYSDGIYYFRLLPWKYFNIFDGGFLFVSMYVAFSIFAFMLSTFLKKWRWREMIGVVSVSASLMLSLSLTITGLIGESTLLIRQGVGILIIYIIYLIIRGVLSRARLRYPELFERGIYILHFGFFVISNVVIILTLLSSEITSVDRFHIYILVGYFVISSLVFITDMQKKNIVIDTVMRTPKLPKVGTIVKVKKGGK